MQDVDGRRANADIKNLAQQRRPVPMAQMGPAFEAVRKLTTGWISAVRPSRQPLCGFLRMRNSSHAINDFPHAEERLPGASRSTHSRDAANFLTASKGGGPGRTPKPLPLLDSRFRGNDPSSQ